MIALEIKAIKADEIEKIRAIIESNFVLQNAHTRNLKEVENGLWRTDEVDEEDADAYGDLSVASQEARRVLEDYEVEITAF